MTDKKKRRVRKHAAKTGMSYQAASNALYRTETPVAQSPAVDHDESCPECDGPVRIELLLQTFQQGFVPDVVTLHVTEPIRRCTKCGFQHSGWEADCLRAEAIRRARSGPQM